MKMWVGSFQPATRNAQLGTYFLCNHMQTKSSHTMRDTPSASAAFLKKKKHGGMRMPGSLRLAAYRLGLTL